MQARLCWSASCSLERDRFETERGTVMRTFGWTMVAVAFVSAALAATGALATCSKSPARHVRGCCSPNARVHRMAHGEAELSI